ncbi:MAG TPA: DMT family transporter [Motiliproteus sp.]
MPAFSLFTLLLLAAIWGGSFLFMRLAATSLGPVLLISLRVGLAALFLYWIAQLWRHSQSQAPLSPQVRGLQLKHNWRHYLLLGGFNSALPFLLFAYAAQTLGAALLSILNATAPLWGALLNALWTRKRLPGSTLLGLALGAVGVTLLVGFDPALLRSGSELAVMAALAAAFSYGIASNYSKHSTAGNQISAFNNAHGSMWAATLLTAPWLLGAQLPPVQLDLTLISAVVGLGILCSGVAYLLYFRLIADLGPTSALTVTFLIPLFGVLWGYWLLDEALGWYSLAGGIAVLWGTALVTGCRLTTLFSSMRKVHA